MLQDRWYGEVINETANLYNTFFSFWQEKFSILTIFEAFLNTGSYMPTFSP